MYNVISSMFNALGKSRIPLYFLIFSSLFNIALDVFLVSQMNMGVAGVAWATLIAQGISAVLSFWVFLREMKKLEGQAEKVYDFRELKDMTRIALPSIFQQSTVSIGMMLVQSVVNGFGSQTLAGFSAGTRVESICIVPMLAMGNAMSSYVAQNLGAKKQERVIEGYHMANWLVVVFSVILCGAESGGKKAGAGDRGISYGELACGGLFCNLMCTYADFGRKGDSVFSGRDGNRSCFFNRNGLC